MIGISKTTRSEEAALRWLAHLESPDLTESEKEAFFSWLKVSEAHQTAYIKVEKLWQRGEVLKYLESNANSQPASRFSWPSPYSWAGWSLACTLIAAITFVTFPAFFAYKENIYQLSTVIGEQKQINLSDGSSVFLNTDSQLKVEILNDKRLAHLVRGEVFFDISTDKERPFEVVTGSGRVRVLGTQFGVKRTEDDVLVTVIEGSVGLDDSSNDGGFQARKVLEANEQLSFDLVRSGHVPQKVDASALLSWRDKQLVYRGETLATVVTDLNRYFPETIHISEPSLLNRQVIAVIHLSDLDSTVNALANSLNLGLEFDRAEQLVLLKTK